jgi:hypothetical protein
MLQLIRDIFLGGLFIFLLQLVVLGFVTYWSVWRLREIPGYALGWLAGFFLIIIYAALIGGNPPSPPDSPTPPLNFFTVVIPAALGIPVGVGAMFLLRKRNLSKVRQSLEVAAVTTLVLVVMFFFSIAWPLEKQMIGIFTIAFCVGAVFTWVLYRPHDVSPFFGQTAIPDKPPTVGQAEGRPAGSRLDQIREDMFRRKDD